MTTIHRIVFFFLLVVFFQGLANAQSTKIFEHEIQPNETLESIASMYGISVDVIKKLNPNSYKFVYAGFTLKVPAEAKEKKDKIEKEVEQLSRKKVTADVSQAPNPIKDAASPKDDVKVPYSSSGFNVMSQTGDRGNFDSKSAETGNKKGHYGDNEVYRRSSLCIIMLTHRGKEYALEMESVFKSMILPLRYNRHDIDVKVIPVEKDMNESSICKILNEQEVAKRVVAKWFNRNKYSGNMNMELVWERGGYNASYEDLKRAQSTTRGTAMLTDEGIELLQNTFVLVCDMDYYNREKTGKGLAIAGAILSVGLGAYGDIQASQGRRDAAATAYAGSALAGVGSAVASDIGGFSVSMDAYLYRLDWSDKSWASICNNFWIDNSTDYSTKQIRKDKFDSDKKSFNLEFIGKYHEKSGRTVFKSSSELTSVIRNVCANTIQKGMKELAKSYPIFRPRAPFYFEDNTMFCRIGTKEDVVSGFKYEIVEPVKKNGVYTYKVVGTAIPFNVWNNHNIRFDQYFDRNMKGTPFRLQECKGDVHRPGLLIRIL